MCETPYLTLKLAREIYHKSPDMLDEAERRRVSNIAARQQEIERRILASAKAANVVLPVASLDCCAAEIRGRYATEAEYVVDLERAGLDADALRDAIERDLKVEAILDQAATAAPAVTDTDVEIFYLQHLDRFLHPETRTLRHILVTINDSLPGSERPSARAKIEAVAERLLKATERFAEQALKHSECPTAMNGGLLGRVPRGQLYAAVEAAAFALMPGALSTVVESPVGFHVLLCEGIQPESQLPLAEVRERIHAHLSDSRRATFQKAWIAGLFQSP